MKTVHSKPIQIKEEIANTFTHGLGWLLSLIALPFLIKCVLNEDFYLLVGIVVYGISLIMVYGTSTLYHGVRKYPLKHYFHILDHISIYFLIAGTHTPFILIYLNTPLGKLYLYILWGMVLAGTIYKLFFTGKLKLISTLVYLGMGWMAVFTIPPMAGIMNRASLYWLIAGGLFYTVGVIFYKWEKLLYHHAIWHIFVLCGSVGHFIAIWLAVKSA
ncbi:MAG: hemolysin III family protein [Bacteroidetes bacterium]|nr:hemolysin III family protein [Bacteroidota bacterium]